MDQFTEINALCQSAARGRLAARVLAKWCDQFGLTESELQLLWCLCARAKDEDRTLREPAGCCDQSAMAKALGYSPAQVSTTVERLRVRGLIVSIATPDDRRRNAWQLAPAGETFVAELRTTPITIPLHESNQAAKPSKQPACWPSMEDAA
ncbi:MAG: winged helix-turn-helix transcriptional regulator [Pirellulales bacterium]|nr:winged helix-turn-helix transcriptional regulator [Pirellulales bacterium]